MTERAAAKRARELLARLIAAYARRSGREVTAWERGSVFGGTEYGVLMQAQKLLRDWPGAKP